MTDKVEQAFTERDDAVVISPRWLGEALQIDKATAHRMAEWLMDDEVLLDIIANEAQHRLDRELDEQEA